jgi:hypothetical protein
METSANIITIMGIVSKEVYNSNYFVNQFNPDGTKIIKIINDTTYEVIKHTDNSTLSGFNALLLRDTKTNKYVIAFRGTEPLSPSDWITDILAGTFNINLQYDNALSFV